MRDRTQPSESAPWYRRQGYAGNLTESEMQELDRFRSMDRHPATQFDELSEEAQAYIARLEVECYDLKQQELASYAFAGTALGIALVLTHHLGVPKLSTFWAWVIGISLVVVSWLLYRRKWNANAREFSAADDGLIQEWEIKYTSRKRKDP